jgi:Ca-activated chloride channel family protein
MLTAATDFTEPAATERRPPSGRLQTRILLGAALVAVLPLTLSAAQLVTPPATAPQITQPALPPAPVQPPPSELPKIVAQLAAQPALSAADCEKLARETITHGQGVRQSGQPLPSGIVQDGLAAVDRGEALDAKATSWPELRSQLQDLLKPPPQQDQQQDEQKKDEQKQDEKKQNQQQQQQDQKQDDQQKSEEQKKQEQQQQQEQQKSEQQKQQEQQQQAQQQPPPEPPKDTQKIGGEKPKDDEAREHPELAVPLQKLDQVRDQDSPAELFELLQNDAPKSPDQPKKDW